MNSTLRLRPASLVAAAVAIVLSQNAVAQEEEGVTALGEITVTARKRAESLQDVPFAISARTGEQLAAAGATNIEDISRNVAGFTVLNLGPGQSQAAIRGVSGGKIDRDLPGVKEQIGVYMDESAISLSLFTPDLDLYDLNRVEVLRGPQGTLFGSGSIGGTVRYISNQPDLSDGYSDFEVGINTVSDGGDGGFVRGMVNVPMGERAALRVVGYHNEIPGFIDAHGPGGTLDEDVNDGERQGGRIALRWELTDNVVVTPRMIYQDIDFNGYNREDAWNLLANELTTTEPRVSIGRREQYRQLDEHFDDDFLLGDLTMEFDLGPAVLTSVSSYTDRDILVTRDATQLTGSVTYFNLGGNGDQIRLNSPLYDYTTVEMFTQELRLSSDYEGGFQWVIGGFYSDTDRHYGQRLPTPGYDDLTELLIGLPNGSIATGAPVPDMPFYSNIPYQIEQIAFFAEANFQLGEKGNVAVGGRYYDFSEDRVLTFGGLFSDPSAGPGSTESDGFLPRVLFSYDVTDDVQLNAQYSEGFRLGGINDPLNLTLCTDEDEATFGGRPLFDDETLQNYEIGAKIAFAEGRGQFNISAFHAEIDDLQAVMLAGSCSSRIVMNVPEAHSTGAEFELSVAPTERFDFGINASYVESKVDSDLSTVIQDGDRQPAVPEFSLSANATYTWPFTATVDGFITGTYQHVGSRYTQIADQRDGFGTFQSMIFTAGVPNRAESYGAAPGEIFTINFDPLMPAYDIGNLRLGVRGDDWEAALFVNNVSDEYARLGLDQERGRVARVGYLVNQPRTYGISFSKSFGHDEPVAVAPPPPPPPPPAPPPPPPPPPPPGDQDKDGVTDDKDRCPNTTPGVAVDEIGCFREVTLRGLLFDTESSAVSAEDGKRIDQAIAQYKSLPDDIEAQTRITIEGHTDNTGSEAYNQALSERRAEAVKAWIVAQGVNPAQITTTGKGETEPTDDNSTAEGRQNNRRVVIRAAR